MPSVSAFKVSAPGSTMLMGEHAVLQGEVALVCAVDARIEVTLRPRPDRQVHIHSSLCQYQSELDQLTPQPALSFVLAAVSAYRTQLPSGFDLIIESGFSSTIGLGSSAAVTAAMVVALEHFAGVESTRLEQFRRGLAIIHAVQEGRGSGADLAASLSGGMVCFSLSPLKIETLPCPDGLTLSLFYCGYKMKTPEVLRYVEKRWQQQPQLLQQLYRMMGATSQAAINALKSADLVTLGRLMQVYQGLMDALGVNDATLAKMVADLRQDPAVLGTKISGSGLGDCVLTLGKTPPQDLQGFSQISIMPATQGALLVEKG
ncbi:mevalonate kinase [Nitrincola sp.]|uniref:mevalonate kinase family protein n=1 Tax=Nitrincola sp. TaxID=1926584 RepID=UPI003A8FCC65